MCTAGKLKADESFCPPNYKHSAGCLAKKRKDQQHMRATEVQQQCKACGEYGHFAVACTNPLTEFC